MTENFPEQDTPGTEPADPHIPIEAGEGPGPILAPVSGGLGGEPSQLENGPSPEDRGVVRGVFIVIASWFVPGLGHLMQRRLGRAIAAFLAVGGMALAGLMMRGTIFPPHGDDAFGVLGFIADAGCGVLYFFAHAIERAGPDASRAAGDYGTRLLATSGVINLLFVLDALEISLGRKN